MKKFARWALPLLAVTTAGLVGWLWPFDGTRPLYAWFPGEARVSGALMKAMEASAEVRLVAVHRPDLVVLQADDAWFAFRLLAAGGLPLAMDSGAVLCRPAGG